MTPLRAKYIRDLAIRGRVLRTQESYTSYVADLARHYGRSWRGDLLDSRFKVRRPAHGRICNRNCKYHLPWSCDTAAKFSGARRPVLPAATFWMSFESA